MILKDQVSTPFPKVYGLPLTEKEREDLKRKKHKLRCFIEEPNTLLSSKDFQESILGMIKKPGYKLSDRQLVSIQLAYLQNWTMHKESYVAQICPNFYTIVTELIHRNLEEYK